MADIPVSAEAEGRCLHQALLHWVWLPSAPSPNDRVFCVSLQVLTFTVARPPQSTFKSAAQKQGAKNAARPA